MAQNSLSGVDKKTDWLRPIRVDYPNLEVKVVLAFTPQDLLRLTESELDRLHHAIDIIQRGK